MIHTNPGKHTVILILKYLTLIKQRSKVYQGRKSGANLGFLAGGRAYPQRTQGLALVLMLTLTLGVSDATEFNVKGSNDYVCY